MQDFYITISNNLLDPKHVRAMKGDVGWGTIWLFMWFLNKMTIINHETGKGKVLGGKPIKYKEVKADLGISRDTYWRWLNLLKEGDYVSTIRTPHGLQITVNKAKKIFGQKVDNDVLSDRHHQENSSSDVEDSRHLSKQLQNEAKNEEDHLTSNIRQYSKTIKEIYKEKKTNSFPSYLLSLSLEDVQEFQKKFNLTDKRIRWEAEKASDWLKSKGAIRKNHKAFLRNWLRNVIDREKPGFVDGVGGINYKDWIKKHGEPT